MDNNNSELKPPELNNNNKIEYFEIKLTKKNNSEYSSVLNDIKKILILIQNIIIMIEMIIIM